jgi:hypothetical protein
MNSILSTVALSLKMHLMSLIQEVPRYALYSMLNFSHLKFELLVRDLTKVTSNLCLIDTKLVCLMKSFPFSPFTVLFNWVSLVEFSSSYPKYKSHREMDMCLKSSPCARNES